MVLRERSSDPVSDRLLAFLRSELDNPAVRYRTPLTPVVGGYETATYRFQLTHVEPAFSKPLVLRLFRPYADPLQALRESAVQNALAAVGYPAAPVFFSGTDKTLLGGAFVIMAYMPGETMLAAAYQDLAPMLGRSQAELHNIVPAPLIETLRARGFQEGSFRFGGRLQWLSVKCEAYPWLAESVHWLLDNRPLEPEHLSICHCDFHPLNILVDGGKVSAVLDWSGFMIGDAAMDVAVTIVMCTIASDPLLGGYRSGEFIPKYLQAYRSVRPLDTAYLDYYRMFRCIMAYVHGAEGQVVWREPSALQALSAHVYEIAKIRVEVPDQTV